MNFLKSLSPLNRLLFPAPNPPHYSKNSLGDDLHFVRRAVASAPPLPCISIAGAADSDVMVVYLHGNGEDLGDVHAVMSEEVRKIWRCAFVAPEFPGYGLADGSPSEASIDAAVVDALFFATRRMSDEGLTQLVIIGRSIGCGPAVRLAAKICRGATDVRDIIAREYLSALITISAFTSLKAVIRHVAERSRRAHI